MSKECFMIFSKQNSVHFVFNQCVQHDLSCRDDVRSYDTSFCSGHHIFFLGGGGVSPLLVSQSLSSKILLRLLCRSQRERAADQQKIRQSVPIRKQNCPRRLKKCQDYNGGGIGDDFPQTVPQLRRLVDGFLRHKLDFDHTTVYCEIFVGKMAMELDVSWRTCLLTAVCHDSNNPRLFMSHGNNVV